MARQATGQIVEHRGKDGRLYRSLRFRANGRRHTLPLGVVSDEEAQRELRHVMADVERGTWQPPEPEQPKAEAKIPTFHEFSAQWWMLSEGQWSENTKADYRWRLEEHLLPYFAETPIDKVTGALVRRYVAEKIAEGQRIRDAAESGKPLAKRYTDKRGRELERPLRPLSPRSINMTVTLLGAILDAAIDDDQLGPLIPRNGARGRRVKQRAPQRTHLDSAEQIRAVLDAAAELDAKAPRDRRHVQRRAMIAALLFSGVRIAELLDLRWRDVDLAGDWLTVNGTKSDQAARKVKMRGGLHAELRAAITPSAFDLNAYVFATRTGARIGADNFRNRVLAAAVKRANEILAARGRSPMQKITPHSLRRTNATVRAVLGDDPGTIADELGHSDPTFSFRVYRQAQRQRRSEQEIAELRAIWDGTDPALWPPAPTEPGVAETVLPTPERP